MLLKYVWLENLSAWNKVFQQYVRTKRKTLAWINFQFYFFSGPPNSIKTWNQSFIIVKKATYIFLKLIVTWFYSQIVLELIFLWSKKNNINHYNKIVKRNKFKYRYIQSKFIFKISSYFEHFYYALFHFDSGSLKKPFRILRNCVRKSYFSSNTEKWLFFGSLYKWKYTFKSEAYSKQLKTKQKKKWIFKLFNLLSHKNILMVLKHFLDILFTEWIIKSNQKRSNAVYQVLAVILIYFLFFLEEKKKK